MGAHSLPFAVLKDILKDIPHIHTALQENHSSVPACEDVGDCPGSILGWWCLWNVFEHQQGAFLKGFSDDQVQRSQLHRMGMRDVGMCSLPLEQSPRQWSILLCTGHTLVWCQGLLSLMTEEAATQEQDAESHRIPTENIWFVYECSMGDSSGPEGRGEPHLPNQKHSPL